MSKGKWVLSLVLPLLAMPAYSSDFNYAELKIKNLDEMQAVINRQITKANGFVKDGDEEQAVAALQSALQFIFSRPDGHDNMVATLIQPVRTKLRELDAYEKTLSEVVSRSIAKIKDKKLKAGDRATQYFVLTNFLAEFKPEAPNNEHTKKLFELIRDAKIELDRPVVNDLKLRGGIGKPLSPSQVAAGVIGAKR